MSNITYLDSVPITKNPTPDLEVLDALPETDKMRILAVIAENPDTSLAVLRRMYVRSHQKHIGVLDGAFSGGREAWRTIKNEEAKLRSLIIGNPNADAALMRMACSDDHGAVRLKAAKSRAIDTQDLKNLANREAENVRLWHLNNEDSDRPRLVFLNWHLTVLYFAIQKLQLRGVKGLNYFKISGNYPVGKDAIKLASDPNADPVALVSMYHGRSSKVRARIVRHSAIDMAMLRMWIYDPNFIVHKAIVARQDVSDSLLSTLLVASGRTERDLRIGIRDRNLMGASVHEQRAWIRNQRELRHRIAKHPNVGPQALVEMARDSLLTLRVHAAMDQRTPKWALMDMLKREQEFLTTLGDLTIVLADGSTVTRSGTIAAAEANIAAQRSMAA